MRELSTQSANDTNTLTDRTEIQKEITQLTSEIDRIGNTTQFNTKNLLDGSYTMKANVTGSNATQLQGVVVGNSATLVNGDAFKIKQTVTHNAESGAGAADGTFKDLKMELFAADGTTSKGSVTFTKADIDAGTTTKTITDAAGNKFDVSIKAAVGATVGNGTGTTTTADTVTIADTSLTFQIGANQGQNIKLGLNDMRATALGVNSLDVSTQAGANAAITTVNNAIEKVSAERSKLGANQNRLEHTINNLSTSSENLTAAESRVRDTDMAKTMMELTKNSILSQAAQAMLAQANSAPQGVLQLLR